MVIATQSTISVIYGNQTHLKHEHVSPSWHWADQDRVEDLIVLFTLCRANVDDLPFQVYKKGIKMKLCFTTKC